MRLAFVGDIYIGPGIEPWASACVPNLHDVLGVDLVIGNFEAVVDGATAGNPLLDKIHLTTPRASLPKLKQIGVDVLSVANNHAADYGPRATEHTIEVLSEVFGAGNVFGWTESPAVELAPNLRVVAACFPETNPVALEGAAGIVIDADPVFKDSIGTAGQTVVYAHWGEEYLSLTAPELRARARELMSAGATHIVGTHSHVVGASEIIGDFSACYGLGNFLFHAIGGEGVGMLRRAKRGTVAVFEWDGSAVISLEEFWRSEFDEKLNLRVRRIRRPFSGSCLSQLHLRLPGSVGKGVYEAALAARWFNLGLGRIIEGVERPSLKKVRTMLGRIMGTGPRRGAG